MSRLYWAPWLKDNQFVSELCKKVQTHSQCNSKVTVLRFLQCNNRPKVNNGHGLHCTTFTDFVVQLLRKTYAFKNNRTTVLHPHDTILGLQLAIATENKKVNGEFLALLSDILLTVNYRLDGNDQENDNSIAGRALISYQKMLADSNFADIRTTTEKLKTFGSLPDEVYLLAGVPSCTYHAEQTLLEALCNRCDSFLVKLDDGGVESEESYSFSEFYAKDIGDVRSENLRSTPGCTSSRDEDDRLRVLSCVFSMLRLLVNNCDELALSTVFTIPSLKLSQDAFTDLKRVARHDGTSLYLRIISHIRAVQLGGSSYQPKPDCPLVKHCDQLSGLVDMIEKLTGVIEEISQPLSAITKVLNIIKKLVVKSNGEDDFQEKVEAAVAGLLKKAEAITEDFNTDSPERSIGNGGSVAGRRTVKVLVRLIDKTLSEIPCMRTLRLVEMGSSPYTPSNIPLRSIVSLYKSPVETEEIVGCLQVEEKKEETPKPKQQNVFSSSRLFLQNQPTVSQYPELAAWPTLVSKRTPDNLQKSTPERPKCLFTPKAKKPLKPRRSLLTDITNQVREEVDEDTEQSTENGKKKGRKRSVKEAKDDTIDKENDKENNKRPKPVKAPSGKRSKKFCRQPISAGQTLLTHFFKVR